MRVGQARKRDYNEPAIVEALEGIGVQVFRCSEQGLADLLCFYRGAWQPVEVKQPRGKLTVAQKLVRMTAPYPVVTTAAEAVALFGCK